MTETLNEEVSVMCNLSKGIKEDGIAEGMEKGMVLAIQNLMDKLKMTAEQAMETMDISKEEYPKYKELLKQSVPKA